MAQSSLSSWSIPKPWFQFLFAFELNTCKCFALLWETRLLLLPSATAFPRSTVGPPLDCCPQPPGTVQLQHGVSSSPPASRPSSQSSGAAAAAGAAAARPPPLFYVFSSLLLINAICSWARANYHTNDFGQCQHFHCAVLLLQ